MLVLHSSPSSLIWFLLVPSLANLKHIHFTTASSYVLRIREPCGHDGIMLGKSSWPWSRGSERTRRRSGEYRRYLQRRQHSRVRGITIFHQHAHPRYHNEGRMWSSWLLWPTWSRCVMSVKPLSVASRQRRRTSYIQPHYSSDHNVFLYITNTCALIKLCYPQVCAAYHQHSVCLTL